MKKWSLKYLIVLCLILPGVISAQSKTVSEFAQKIQTSFNADKLKPSKIYKIRDKVEVHYFALAQKPGNKPALIYIHGGGWLAGSPKSTYRWCRYLAEHGVSAFSIRYELASEKKGIKPSQCLMDVKTAVRWIRSKAETFGIDPNRIAVSGSSAGGHLAASLSTIKGYNHPDDDLQTGCQPNLLVLGCPAIDNGPGGFGNDRVKDFWRDFSPAHNLNEKLPDCLVILGDKDPLISMGSVEKFGHSVIKSGKDFEWWVFPGKGHSAFNYKKSYLTPEYMYIYYAYHAFLAKHKYISTPLPAGDEVRHLVKRREIKNIRKVRQVLD